MPGLLSEKAQDEVLAMPAARRSERAQHGVQYRVQQSEFIFTGCGNQVHTKRLTKMKKQAIIERYFVPIEALRTRLGRSNRRSSLSLILRPDGLPRYRDKASSLSATTTEF
jgi:hypothetical protein